MQTVTVTATPSAVAKANKGEKAADKLKKAKANHKAMAAVKKGAEKKAEKADKKVDKGVDAKNATIVQPDPTLSSVNSTASATPVSKPIRRSLLLQRW